MTPRKETERGDTALPQGAQPKGSPVEVHLLGFSPRDGGFRGALEVLIQLVWEEPARVLSPLLLLACSLRWDQEGTRKESPPVPWPPSPSRLLLC